MTTWFSIVALVLSITALAATGTVAWRNDSRAVDSESRASPIVTTIEADLDRLWDKVNRLSESVDENKGNAEESISKLSLDVSRVDQEMKRIGRTEDITPSQSESPASVATNNQAPKTHSEESPKPVTPTLSPNDSNTPPN